MNSLSFKRRDWFVLILLFVGLFVVEVMAVHRYLISPTRLGTNDFYSRWAGARALLIEGRDPYGLDVTTEIQEALGAQQAEGRSGFHYPLHVVFLFWPLINVSYPWTQSVWITTLQWLVIFTIIVSLIRLRWQPSPLGIAGLFIAGILFYPVARTMLLGQFTIHVTFFLALSLLLLQRGHDGWAGVLLAATSIKPQVIVLVGIWLALWTLYQRRWRFLGGVLGGGLVFFLGALLLYPRWPLSFYEDMLRYATVAGGRNPITVLLETTGLGEVMVLRYVFAGLMLLGMLYAWWRSRDDEGELFELGLYWTIVLSVIVPFQTGSTNQVILLIPFFTWLWQGVQRWGGWVMSGATAVLIVGLWGLFVNTISGDYENPIMFLPLPFLALFILLATEINRQRRRQP